MMLRKVQENGAGRQITREDNKVVAALQEGGAEVEVKFLLDCVLCI